MQHSRLSILTNSHISHVGEISTRAALDREHQSSYQLIVVVQDGGTPPRSATGTAHITVLDENDNAPAFCHTQPGREILIQARNRLAQTIVKALNQCVITSVLLFIKAQFTHHKNVITSVHNIFQKLFM